VTRSPLQELIALLSQIKNELSSARSDLAESRKQHQSEIAAVRAEIAELRTDLDAQIACLRQPGDLRAAQTLIALRLKSGRDLPDDVHEKALRLQLQLRPYDMRLTYSLVSLLHRLDRPPMPDVPPEPAVSPRIDDGSVDALVEAANACGRVDDLFGVYAHLWQACMRFPGSVRGWAEYSRCFAERYEWKNCRIATALAVAAPGIPDVASANALLAGLCGLAEHNRMGDLDWEPWFDRLPEAQRLGSRGARLLVARGRGFLPSFVKLAQRAGESSEDWLTAAKVAFAQERVPEAYDCLRRALDLDAAGTLQAVVRDWSHQASVVIDNTEKTDELAAWLANWHAENPSMNLVPDYPAPDGHLHGQRLRNGALERGLPSAVFVPLNKSASTTVLNILGSGFRLPTVLYSLVNLRVVVPWLADFLRGGALYGTHLLPSSRNIDLLAAGGVERVIVHVRDPRQVVISLMEHARLYPREVLPSARERLGVHSANRVETAIREFLPGVVAWIKGWVDAREKLAVEFTSFEEFVHSPNEFVDRLVALYGGDTRYFDRQAALAESPMAEYHRRRGKTDEWRQCFNAGQIEHVNAQIPDNLWKLFGWSA
jgi:hypothetical protein